MSFINAESDKVPVECDYDALKPEINDECLTLRILETLENN